MTALQDFEATLAGADGVERSNPIHDASAWGPGDRIGRYVVLERLGAGAMGVVVAAYDPALDRRVAIKLIQDPGVPGGPDAHRKLREAQTLARLSHPNVVAVHDVGEIEPEGIVFIAMEYIAGTTLQRWLEQPRSIRTIVGVFLQAGRGLAAAHAAGITHRDFKPANVMIEDDPQGVGRVRVMDFGIARAHTTEPAQISDGYTKSGRRKMSGTPAYMAPEQHLDRTVGPAADQFAFCIALHEAIVGTRPFTGTSPAEIAYSVTHDAPAMPPRSLPENVRRVLARGLERSPEQRFPDMDALLRELSRDPGRARRRWLGVTGAALGLAGLLFAVRDDDRTCERVADAIEEVWGAQQREDLQTRISAVTSADVATRTTEELDRYAATWRAQRNAACIDAHDDTSEPELVERRTVCLENARDQYAAVIDTLATEAPEHSFEVLSVLAPLRSCVDGKILRLTAPLPADPQMRGEVARVRSLLARQLTLESAVRLDDAKLTLARAELEGAQLGDEALLAEIQLARGGLLASNGEFEESAEALVDAVWMGLRARHQSVAIRAATRLVFVTGDHLQDTAAAELWFELAQSLLIAAEVEDSPMWADLWQVRGAMLRRAERHDEARDACERALEIARRLQDHRIVSLALQTLALSYRQLQQYERSNELATDAIGVLREAYGPAHPMLGMLQGVVGVNLIAMGEPERASAALQEALASLELTLSPVHFKVLETRWNVCLLEGYRARYAEQSTCFDAMLPLVRDDPQLSAAWSTGIVEQLLVAAIRNGEFSRVPIILSFENPPVSLDRWSDTAYAEIAMLEGRYDDADALIDHAIAGLERDHPNDLAETFWTRCSRVRVALRTGRVERARATIAELEPARATLPPKAALFFDALAGRVALAAGEPQQAVAMLTAATQVLADNIETREWPETAEALADLARAHVELGSDRATAMALAHRAMDIYERLPGYRIDRDALAAWLASTDTADTRLHD